MRGTAFYLTISLALGLLPDLAARCQEIDSLRTGESIRLNVKPPTSHRVEGKLLWLSNDTIVLRLPREPISIGLSDVASMAVKRRTGGSFMRSAVLGLLGGVLSGVAFGAISGDTNTGDGILTAGDKALIGAVVVGGAGLIGGAVYGACCSSSWQPVPVPGHR